MGNHISCVPSDSTGKIVYWDGSIQEFEKPLMAAELMLEHPQQVVVEYHSAVNQKWPTPLPADKTLERNKIYLMLPMKRGKPIKLNSEESRRILMMVNSTLHSKFLLFSSRFVPWLARICHDRTIVEGVPMQKKQGMEKKEERYVFPELLPEIIEGAPEYLSRQFSGKGWKPSLDTIKEKQIERKMSGCLFLKSF